ncbi:MAG: family 10 glycosylhydrolase [Clostridiaceae bacterium]|nr:family 10 glycosylhydrolase [Clostridiaceae bacterium]
MKYIRRSLTLIIIFILLLNLSVFADTNVTSTSKSGDFRGLWVATVVNIDYPVKATTDSEVLKKEALQILNYAKNTGFNAVFLQVRPSGDALYKSKYYPWSKYLTGKQGVAPSGGFDPLEFWIAEAHKRGLELHAWINPYRVTKRSSGEPIHDYASLHSTNPAKKNPSWTVKHPDGNIYYNPGMPEARQLIINGVLEIIENYSVDGIHFDDYFYPDSNFNDSETYKKYNTTGKSLDNWRRDNVNTLVRDVSTAIKNSGKSNIRFGISPFGIWANKDSHPLGSDTKGLQSYFSHYADSLYWINNEIIDYIVPQIYWNIGYSIADYKKLSAWWENAVSGTNVDLYIGHAAYKAENPDPKSPWYGTAEIERQLVMNDSSKIIKGSVFFNYNVMAKSAALTNTVKSVFDRRDGKTPKVGVKISRPGSNITTSMSSFYLNGESDPSQPLYLNGKIVENRSPKGYFGVLVPLSVGKNTFAFTQSGSSDTCTITRKAAASGSEKMSAVEIPSSSAFPQSQEFRMPGEKITLTCQAPAGSTVTVKLNGKTYTMKQTSGPTNPSGLYKATYSVEYTMPSYTGTPRNINLGAPLYTVNYKGTIRTRTAPANVGVIMKGSPYFAEAINDVVDTYNAPVSGNGAAYEIYKGMVDYVTGMTGSYARLSSGQWVFKDRVRIYSQAYSSTPIVRKATYKAGQDNDVFELTMTSLAAAVVSYDGQNVVLNVSAPSSAAMPILPNNSLISTIKHSTSIYKTEYVLTRKDNATIEGYYVEKTDTGIKLVLKRKPEAQSLTEPLKGITIMLDAGHGGTDPGAIGPLGTRYSEKDINLALSFKLKRELESQGANVLMTRTDNSTISLADRLTMSRNARPDMFISLHANSMPDDVDISKIRGFSVFYREVLSKPSAQLVYDAVISQHGKNKHGVNKKNFYVTRNTWAPSFLLESDFVPNPVEFEWLTNDVEQDKLAKTISTAVVKYYTN